MTKAELEQFLKLKNEILVLEYQLASLRDKAEEDSRIYGLYSLTGDPESEIERRENELEQMKTEFTRQLRAAERFIDGIEESRTRTVFRLRYMEGWPWLPIAFQIGYSDEQRPRKIHNGYLMQQADEQKRGSA
ncbi:hypothetical protein RWV98_05575 [Agathobaculum sp. NTUH-O15-33]|uniref:hypothetical protein n=1 Tax=Agathobaculum sp. NTUH-O15-33 TaxID=3079302 RepID=UPI002958C28E|nr:hypothetical protein [Agathobaculum sp. NTUH-O15-33]WNX85737.1 hypothetical protein RWV98_05575 [Agathobaculum sp. NTUH-O15-33]